MNEFSETLTQFLNCSVDAISRSNSEEVRRNEEILMQIIASPQFLSVF